MVAEEGDDYYDNFVLPKANSIVPVVTGGLSLIGSYIILREVFVDRHNNRGGKAIARLLTSLSIADVLWSVGSVMSTFVAPSDLDYIWGNIGNQQTCTLQGFLLCLGYMAPPRV